MIEREMQTLLWEHPEKLLGEPLKQLRWEASSTVGRADLVFLDRHERILVVEVKLGKLGRGAIDQIHDYFGMLKREFPEKPVELMVVANSIPEERRLALGKYDIEYREISEKRFRDVASEVGFSFKSEIGGPVQEITVPTRPDRPGQPRPQQRFGNRVEKGWYYWSAPEGKEYFLAFVNAKGSCSIRFFDAKTGRPGRKQYESGDFQEVFRDYITKSKPAYLTDQPNLERAFRDGLPSVSLLELRRSVGLT